MSSPSSPLYTTPRAKSAEVEGPSRKIPSWAPISAFVGTSLALAIPLVMIRRQRANVARLSLKNSVAPPPRRSAATGRASLPTTSTVTTETVLEAYSSESTSPGVGEMMSALSRMNASSALLAAKAFGIATALVAVSGAGLTWGVKTVLGVQDAREFGQAMRHYMWSFVPSLTERIHRAPETADEYRQVRQVAPSTGEEEQWSWDKAEKRLKKAYEEGGVPLWAQTALREVEAEARMERAKREKEFGKA